MRLPVQKGRRWLVLAGTTIVLGVLVVLAASGRSEARGSVLSRGPGGWLAARRYLEVRGARVRLLDGPLGSFQSHGVLVTAFPWQQGLSEDAGEPLEAHLRRGGSLVLAYSGDPANPAERVALKGLGLSLGEVRKLTLNPLRWRRFSREEWDLRPAPGVKGDGEPVSIWAPREAPVLPKQARTLFQGPGGQPLVAALSRHRGTVWLVPADAFANARLGKAGNADLLETLRRGLGDDWTFDEYHHGFTGRPLLETVALGRTLDLILLHLTVLYLAAVLVLARPFGPAWSEAPVVAGSAGAFLLGLGAIHHRLGHHREAAERLLKRVRELDRDFAYPDPDRRVENAGGLIALARDVARRRRGLGPENERETDA
ncbi:MAG TPA: DUF4350 domain-containing protein [Thermoanaerobaculia bacterium]|jgi:hypothetical protein|nr:DUF4350 domain-containing protein [Thermoanaerobaculia bacterium]